MADVKVSGGEDIIVGDRCGSNCCNPYNHGCGGWNNNGGWGAVGGALVGGGFGAAAVSVWDKINDTKRDIESVKTSVKEAQAGIYKDISDAARGVTDRVDGVGKEVLNNRFTTERGLCDLGYKINSDIRDSRDAQAAGDQEIMNRLCTMSHQISDCCCENKMLIQGVENRLALQAERNFCELKQGQDQIKCLIENTAKDQEIARLNRVIDKQRDQNIISSIIAAMGGTAAAAVNAARNLNGGTE